MSERSLSSPTLLGFLWSNRRSFANGMAFALARILCVAPFPIIFKFILDVYMPAKDSAGILKMCAVMCGLLALHQC